MAQAIAALVGHGLPVDFESKKGCTALMEAARAGVFPSIDMLVGCGANINFENKNGMTALMEACAEGRSHLVTAMVKRGARVDYEGCTGLTPLILVRLFLFAVMAMRREWDEKESLVEEGLYVGAEEESGVQGWGIVTTGRVSELGFMERRWMMHSRRPACPDAPPRFF